MFLRTTVEGRYREFFLRYAGHSQSP